MDSPHLILDLECEPASDGRAATIFAIGALRTDDGRRFERKNLRPGASLTRSLAELDALAQGAACVVGHNVLAHDLRLLREQAPQLALLRLSVIDTLRLAPLAFPQNPYHRLVKDHKLLTAALNSPLADCDATATLLQDQRSALQQLERQRPLECAVLQGLIAPKPGAGLGDWFAGISGRAPPTLPELIVLTGRLFGHDRADDLPGHLSNDAPATAPLKVCRSRLKTLLQTDLADPALHWPIAYTLAWLRVAGGNSILAPWVRHQFPATARLITELRDRPCADPACGYCRETHDAQRQLKRFFGFDDFRAEPADAAGHGLQRQIVQAGLADDRHVLAVLPTGGGKSLCYQLPALVRNWRNGSLTIVISPLQSLMKDQVDGLENKSVLCAAALNGLLTPAERADVLEKIEFGEVGLLFVAPEQFRSRSFKSAIRHRQIGAWIFDEAHCVSKWGHDFRPDYLYAARFIREFTGDFSVPPICCFTATAKLDVLADIRRHFKDELGVEFEAFLAAPRRDNLQFEVMPTPQGEKWARTHELLHQHLEGSAGGAIVFVARRKSAEQLAEFLRRQDWLCEPFHAGLPPQTKRDRQDAFIRGELRVIVATNAFGMGVDKPDVRLVVHAEIPGSLENYLQEAGRAGRDQQASHCVLLYDPDDIETQFGISERSRLSEKDIKQILKKLRFVASRRGSAPVVITAGEILADEHVQTSFDAEDRDADTKVATAVAWLERAKFLQRNENRINVYPAKLLLPKLEDAARRLDTHRADFSQRKREQYLNVLGLLYGAPADKPVSTDELMRATGLEVAEVENLLRDLEHLELLENDTRITLYLHTDSHNSSAIKLRRSLKLETALIARLRELAPDADQGGWQTLDLRALTSGLRDELEPKPVAIDVQRLLRALSQDRDTRDEQTRSHFELREQGLDVLALRIRGGASWGELDRHAERRRVFADKLLAFLLAKLPAGQIAKDLLVETTIGELVAMVEADLELAAQVRPDRRARLIQRVLLYLHREEVLVLNHGMTVLRRAMTIRVDTAEKRRYLRDDFLPLDEHYQEKRIQVHVMREYAEVAVKQLAAAIRLVGDYFALERRDFLRRYFADKAEVLDLATSEASWRRIVDGLNPVQRAIVEQRLDGKGSGNRLVLAGPGSGKTRVIVHRVAWLLRVQRVPAAAIIVLTFNRHAAAQVRSRLRELVGTDAIGVTVLTYHAMAMRLMGVSFQRHAGADDADLNQVIRDAARLLDGGSADPSALTPSGFASLDGESPALDDLRERLLGGYRFILVDEYQDIDAGQYELVSALAGRRRRDADERLTILAVGDDDQNVYEFRDTSNRFIARFEQDWDANRSYLVENYRSTRHVIEAANVVIAQNRDRLKRAHPIRIDAARAEDPRGGRWQALDPSRAGRVLRLVLPTADRTAGNVQCQGVLAEFTRLLRLDAHSGWPDCAVLARTKESLQPFIAWCRQRGLSYLLAAEQKDNPLPATRQRDFVRTIELLQSGPATDLTPHEALALIRAQPLEPAWLLHFDAAADELIAEFGDADGLKLSRRMLIDWLYEHAHEQRRVGAQGLFLGTVHAAKGLEFKHVAVLGDWRDGNAAERRLHYVAMTRAKETLTLCEFGSGGGSNSRSTHPFVASASAAGATLQQTVDLPFDPLLATRYRQLHQGELDLGFAGRQPADRPVHAATAALAVGDVLRMRPAADGRIEFCDAAGVAVARTVPHFDAGAGMQHAEVGAVLARDWDQGDARFHTSANVKRWWLPMPLLSSWAQPPLV